MTSRNIVCIDEAKCDGCGECVTACAEGAIALVDGKTRLVSESHCDGLGACLAHCPRGAITVEAAEAVPLDEAAIARRPGHAAADATPPRAPDPRGSSGCPGSRVMSLSGPRPDRNEHVAPPPSTLRQWPVQLHLVSPAAPYFRGADVLLAADCVAYAVGDFHRGWLAGRALAIACPKLDVHQELYLDKLVSFIDDAGIASLTVMVMEVPCCGGLVRLAQAALARAARAVPLQTVAVGVGGEVQVIRAVVSPQRGATCPSLPAR